MDSVDLDDLPRLLRTAERVDGAFVGPCVSAIHAAADEIERLLAENAEMAAEISDLHAEFLAENMEHEEAL